MASPDNRPFAAKPGTACLCCRRRKLKCSREVEGCINCSKADLPCVYPSTDTGVKRKRGPYKKKNKPAREAHLEHVVKYLSDPVRDATGGLDVDHAGPSPSAASPRLLSGLGSDVFSSREPAKASEELVKDALIALTNTSVSDRDLQTGTLVKTSLRTPPAVSSTMSDRSIAHPSPAHMLDLWQLFTTRVDPLTKVINCRIFAPRLFAMLAKPQPGPLETLACGVYYAAISSCSTDEAQLRFGQSKAEMLQQYGHAIETSVADNYEIPELEHMQGLVLYLICLRREHAEAGLWALFSLAVRNAQMMGLHEDPGQKFSPFEAEMRRRLWWCICSLEARCAEEGASRSKSLLAENVVQLPANLEDSDFVQDGEEAPEPREGLTSMGFVLSRWENMRLSVRLWQIKRSTSADGQPLDPEEIRTRQMEEYQTAKARLDARYLRYCHQSRPFDWLIMALVEVMAHKCRLAIEYPWGHMITRSMTQAQRLDMLHSSVVIIRNTHLLVRDDMAHDWRWYFRGYVQWHSLAIVILEIANSTNAPFVKAAWTVLDPFLDIWDRVYQSKRHDAPWEHVNEVIGRARATRQVSQEGVSMSHRQREKQVAMPQSQSESQSQSQSQSFGPHASCTGGILPFDAMADLHPDVFALGTQVPGLAPPAYTGCITMSHDAGAGLGMDVRVSSSDNLPATGDAVVGGEYLSSSMPDMQDFDIPYNIDFDALNAVFGSSSWETAVEEIGIT